MKLFLTLSCLILSNYIMIAQNIHGIIIDEVTEEPLPGVNISLDGKGGTSSNINGEYQLNLSPGQHSLVFQYIGYKDIHKNIILNQDESITLNIVLLEQALELNTVVVSAGKFEQKIEETTISMEVIKPSLIEQKNTTNIEPKV